MEKIEVLDKISKISIYLLVFLVPIFFLPFTQNVLDYPKQVLLVSLVSVSLICQIIKFLIEGKITFNFHSLHFLVLFTLLIFGFSTLFSKSRAESFFGFPLTISQSFLTLLFLIIFYFLINSLFEKREIFYLLFFFSISIFLATLFSTLQIFGKFIFPFEFSKQIAFNTISSPNSFALLLVSLLPLFLILFSVSKRLIKIFLLISILLSLFFLLLLNLKIAFLILIISFSLFLGFLTTKREIFSPSLLIFSLFFLAISISFLLFNLRIFPVQIPLEIYLNQKTSFAIALKSLKENPIFGSGPATFLYQFLKHKGTILNDTTFWNVRFFNSVSRFFDILSTTGILGTISFLSLIFLPLYFGFLKLFREGSEKFDRILSLAIFLSILNFAISFFLYSPPLTFDFSYFLLLSCLAGILSDRKKEFLIKKGTPIDVVFSFFLILIFVLDFIVLILISQRYIGEVYYWKGILSWQKGNVDQTISNLQKATNFAKIDLYFRDLSQAYLAKLNDKVQKGNWNIQTEASQAINFSRIATDLNKINVANWSVRGFTYQSLVGMAQGAEDWAIKCYNEAINLEPGNPYYLTQKGMILLRKGILSQNEKEKGDFFASAEDLFKKAIELKSDFAPAHFQLAMVYYNRGDLDNAISKMEETKNLAPLDVGLAFQLGVAYYQKGDYQKAKEELERAISITPDYANALYFLGLTYDQLGEREKAIEKFKRVSELNPDNEEVKKIISNLESGKKALEGTLPTVPPKTPIEEKPPEIKR
jgi:tetratricopeptide (TPR) repeat protein